MSEHHQPISDSEDESKWLMQLVGSIVGLTVAIGGIAIYAPSCIASGYIEKRDEMIPVIQQIKKAELAYFAEHARYLAVAPYLKEPTGLAYPWKSEDAGAFNELGFQPTIETRSSYSVVLEGDGFMVIGVSDVDGDSIEATYVATRDKDAELITNPKIY